MMRPADIERLIAAGAPTVHPDGDRAVAAVGHPDLGADANVAQLWQFPIEGGAPRRLTLGRSDRAPRFSPDGRMLAFLRAADGASQLQVVDARGGEPTALTARKLGVEEFVWSPDSRTIVFASREPEKGRYGTVEGLGPGAEPPRRITASAWHENGLGWNRDRRRQLFAVDVPGLDDEPRYRSAPTPDGPGADPEPPVAHPLTTGDADHGAAFFSPDGVEVWFVAALHEGRDDDLRTDLYRVRVDDPGEPEGMTTGGPARDIAAAGFAPDGRLWAIAAELGTSGRSFVGTQHALYIEDGGLRAVTDPEVHQFDPSRVPLAFDDRGRALAILAERGREVLTAIDAEGGIERLSGPDEVVLAADAAGGRVVAAVATADRSGELRLLDPEPRTLSDVGAGIAALDLVAPIEEEHPSRDGYPVHGWVAIPEGAGPHPVLLMIHGGPFTQYGVQLFDETQVWVSAGYAVVYANPRGSLGYGQAHGRSIAERMGTVDLDDVLAFLDGAVAGHPELDGSRVGILGGSYGGYLTAWTIAHDHRFAAAVVERGFLDPEVFIGTSDIGAFFADEYLGPDPAHRAAQSPQAVVDRVRTPTLVLHSEDDLRCPLSQATRYYSALRRNGVETELLVFPGEDHELSRSGRPRHRVQRFEAILDWFGRHLPVEAGD